jgi:hypothetical protein
MLNMKIEEKRLRSLRKKIFEYYMHYREGQISQEDYLFKIKPIDQKIDMIELAFVRSNRIMERE